MSIDAGQLKMILAELAATIASHATELGELDRAIGDGDHGINLSRGFGAVAEHLDEIAFLPPDKALIEVGKRLVMTVGGASGPLYGTFFMSLGKALGGSEPVTRERLFAALDAAVAAVKARGKSEVGQKTLLDVLIPVQTELHAGDADLVRRLRARAQAAAAATIPMRAQRGRAAFLGERSIGHLDPGARSSQLLIDAVCDALSRDAAAAAAEPHRAE
ncbi:MAG: dihydroxyacetone kinase subunit DhaL [Candidatus Velthaea sp.]|jgi:dihydroxyacetone kinase-like protein